jgi:hypothetical protein
MIPSIIETRSKDVQKTSGKLLYEFFNVFIIYVDKQIIEANDTKDVITIRILLIPINI